MNKLRGNWFGDEHDAREFSEAATSHGRNYEITARAQYELFIPRRAGQILKKSDFIILPLSLPEFGSLWLVEQANRAGSAARVILRSTTDADPAALCQLYDGCFRPEDTFLPVFDMIEATSQRIRDGKTTGALIERILETSYHFRAVNDGILPTLKQVRARPQMRRLSSTPPARVTLTAIENPEIDGLKKRLREFGGAALQRPWVFLSYASSDAELVSELYVHLKEARILSWFDQDQIDPGFPIIGEIARGLNTCGVIAVFLSRASIQSAWVLRELNFARALRHSSSLKYLPILIEDLEDHEVPEILRGISHVDLRERSDAQHRQALAAIAGLVGNELSPMLIENLASSRTLG